MGSLWLDGGVLRFRHDEMRRIRTLAGLTPPMLAERAELSDEAIRQIEAGKVRPRESTVLRIAEALGIDTADLYETEAA